MLAGAKRANPRMASEHGGAVPEGPSAAALYIASLTEELAQLAKGYNLETLAHILNMARLEADEIIKGRKGPVSASSDSNGAN